MKPMKIVAGPARWASAPEWPMPTLARVSARSLPTGDPGRLLRGKAVDLDGAVPVRWHGVPRRRPCRCREAGTAAGSPTAGYAFSTCVYKTQPRYVPVLQRDSQKASSNVVIVSVIRPYRGGGRSGSRPPLPSLAAAGSKRSRDPSAATGFWAPAAD